MLSFGHSIRWNGLGFIFQAVLWDTTRVKYHAVLQWHIYCLMIISLILKLKTVRITNTGKKAYNTKKSVVNRDVAPGKVTSMNWIPWEYWQRDPTPAETLEWPGKKMFRLICYITNLKLNSDLKTWIIMSVNITLTEMPTKGYKMGCVLSLHLLFFPTTTNMNVRTNWGWEVADERRVSRSGRDC